MQIISRAEAKSRGLTRYFTGKPCPQGHVAEHWVGNRTCIECREARSKPMAEKLRSADGRRAKRKVPGR